MSGDIIERVARAILAEVPFGYGMTQSEAEKYARAAIAAMREPDEAMIRAARLAMIRDDLQPTESEVEAGWRAAIDEALSETAASPFPNPSNSDE